MPAELELSAVFLSFRNCATEPRASARPFRFSILVRRDRRVRSEENPKFGRQLRAIMSVQG
jgi:hypothetical protein